MFCSVGGRKIRVAARNFVLEPFNIYLRERVVAIGLAILLVLLSLKPELWLPRRSLSRSKSVRAESEFFSASSAFVCLNDLL